ncbi:MAG: hypothetical protein HC879_01305 [Leptolyngbyaceae cyanobacterium SL_5_9]|nr:hypothetical protein [Leptolyngbyaceae cyanobacterium SL_5_9]
MAFALFPANTNHAWLTSAFGILPASILFLIASHLYLSDGRRNRIFSYLLIFTSLFCYEKFLPLFWVAPLLKPTWKWNRRSRQELFRYAAILIALMLVVLLIRTLVGEPRIGRLIQINDDKNSVLQVLLSITAGPVVSIAALIMKPIQAFMALEVKWIVPLSLLLLAIAYGLHFSGLKHQTKRPPTEAASKHFQRQSSSLWRLLIAGFVALVLAYVLTLTGDEDNIYLVMVELRLCILLLLLELQFCVVASALRSSLR